MAPPKKKRCHTQNGISPARNSLLRSDCQARNQAQHFKFRHEYTDEEWWRISPAERIHILTESPIRGGPKVYFKWPFRYNNNDWNAMSNFHRSTIEEEAKLRKAMQGEEYLPRAEARAKTARIKKANKAKKANQPCPAIDSLRTGAMGYNNTHEQTSNQSGIRPYFVGPEQQRNFPLSDALPESESSGSRAENRKSLDTRTHEKRVAETHTNRLSVAVNEWIESSSVGTGETTEEFSDDGTVTGTLHVTNQRDKGKQPCRDPRRGSSSMQANSAMARNSSAHDAVGIDSSRSPLSISSESQADLDNHHNVNKAIEHAERRRFRHRHVGTALSVTNNTGGNGDDDDNTNSGISIGLAPDTGSRKSRKRKYSAVSSNEIIDLTNVSDHGDTLETLQEDEGIQLYEAGIDDAHAALKSKIIESRKINDKLNVATKLLTLFGLSEAQVEITINGCIKNRRIEMEARKTWGDDAIDQVKAAFTHANSEYTAYLQRVGNPAFSSASGRTKKSSKKKSTRHLKKPHTATQRTKVLIRC